jgi:hypothetical protein
MTPFAPKLDLVLKALSMSRGRLAASLGVDKSVVSRWASGAVTPSALNLGSLTALIASRRPGFTLLDWDRDLAGLAQMFGVEAALPAQASVANVLDTLFAPVIEAASKTTDQRMAAYEGFWRATVPAPGEPVFLMTFHGMMRREPNGLLLFRGGCAGLLYEGWVMLSEGKLFGFLVDRAGGTPMSFIWNSVSMPKAVRLEGLIMLALIDTTRTPMAAPMICERIGDLTRNAEADDLTCEDLLTRSPVLEPGELSPEIEARLVRDFGPSAAASGGDLLLLSSPASALTLGALA